MTYWADDDLLASMDFIIIDGNHEPDFIEIDRSDPHGYFANLTVDDFRRDDHEYT